MFKILGVLVAAYVVTCLVTGRVYAKAGPWGRTRSRESDGAGYWGAVGSYTALALALLFLF